MKILFYLKFKSIEGQNLFLTTNFKKSENPSDEETHPMTYIGGDTWSVELEIPTKKFSYYYFIKDVRDNSITKEWGERFFNPFIKSKDFIICDIWNYPTLPEFNLTTDLFKNIAPDHSTKKSRVLKQNTHRFNITFPLFNEEEVMVILGASEALGAWNEDNPTIMHYRGNGQWEIDLDLAGVSNFSAYKYAVYNKKEKKIVYFEEGENRWFPPNQDEKKMLVINDNNFKQPKEKRWRGSGISIPVFSLRTEKSLGVGEFLDLIPFGEWCQKAGFSLIQILPIHDSTATHSWEDCYPYAAISVFALHPMYLNLENLNYKLTKAEQDKINKTREKLNKASGVEYEKVNKFKREFINSYFKKHFKKIQKNKTFDNFIEENSEWLKPYAVFCTLRDHYKTVDFSTWKKNKKSSPNIINKFFKEENAQYFEVLKHCYVQWQLHLQLRQAVEKLHELRIGLKGDLPIGVYRNSVDVWDNPELFHTDEQAGAPPDDFAVMGQNWAFPTYNWEEMMKNNFDWWKQRFQFMERYFDAFRIDHILGFFRIWQIPSEQIQGILGRFEPSIPIYYNELKERGINLSIERLTKPFLTYNIIESHFGEKTQNAIELYFNKIGEDLYDLKPEFDTQRKVIEALSLNDNSTAEKLLDLITNVLFIKDKESEEALYPRYALYQTSSFDYLNDYEKSVLKDLHEDYFFERQEQYWKEKGLEKLPLLKQSTNMLTCGEDLGMVPKVVPQVMTDLAILSLEIQRMPKAYAARYSHPADAPYLCVVSPSSHDTSTLRQWWKENRENTQYFYNNLMGHYGNAPEELSPELLEEILHQHLFSPAMLCVIPIQEFLGIDEELRNPDENSERINIPAIYPHKWKYRMHVTIENLLTKNEFNTKLFELNTRCGRI